MTHEARRLMSFIGYALVLLGWTKLYNGQGLIRIGLLWVSSLIFWWSTGPVFVGFVKLGLGLDREVETHRTPLDNVTDTIWTNTDYYTDDD